jgi:genome maintenance exonuclease 1
VKEAGRQYYVSEGGDRFPSVTTILNATKPREDWERLLQWQQRVGVEQAAEITRTASRRGTGTHRYIRRYLQGETVVCSDAVRPYWESVKPVLESVDMVRLVEGTVFHRDLGYAGVVDCVASYEGVPCICEWKTADKPKQTVERLYDYPLQVAAYWGAVNHLYRDNSVNLHHAMIAIALPDHPAEIFWFDSDAIAQYWEQWQVRVRQYRRRLSIFR